VQKKSMRMGKAQDTLHQMPARKKNSIMPTFSIIIPTCNRPVLLMRSVTSVVRQTFKNFEIIIVNDGDADVTRTVERCNDDRIKLIQHVTNSGAAASYNTGIKNSSGQFICCLDDDDEYLPEFLQKTYDFFQAAPQKIGFVWTGIQNIEDIDGREIPLNCCAWPAEFNTAEEGYIASTTIGNGFGLTVRRECYFDVGLYNEEFIVCNDTEFLFRLSQKYEFSVIPDILVKIHRHSRHQLTHTSKNDIRIKLHQRIVDENKNFLRLYPKLYDVHFNKIKEMKNGLKNSNGKN